MPITFSPDNIPAERITSNTASSTPLELLKSACPSQYIHCEELLQSSFSSTKGIRPQTNGFVDTVIHAYNNHHHLIIRPDDVWTAILVQFNFFVNANSEALRSLFVAHEGKKELTVEAVGTRFTVDFGTLAKDMTSQIDENILDPALREWILPRFTTTTDCDTVVFAIVMMATMKKYFHYEFHLRCGLPSVTLEGERSDWEDILGRIEKLKEYGLHTTAWYHLLKPVISRFVKAFDDPNGLENLEFWRRVCHKDGGGSGPSYIGGWVSAFCVFDEEGKWLSHVLRDSEPGAQPALPAHDFLKPEVTEFFQRHVAAPLRHWNQSQPWLVIDGSPYHVIDSGKIPVGYAEVDVLVNDNGVEFPSMMTAGSVGMKVSSSSGDGGSLDMVRPVTGWWMFTKRPENKAEE
ncbi:hypothetical protein BU17DRAFT_59420 [Hysterangium stoloniferum]|nr:hypothetical protein BU17DRAFT_59420 [Hysterangium stoloniferum]